jgi:hypothetical protein
MKKNLFKSIQNQLKGLKCFTLLLIITALTCSLFGQGGIKNDIVVTGKWDYSKKDFSGILIKERRKYAKYDSVTIAISNNTDSLKLIRSVHCVNRKKESYWEFESGTVLSFNKFGESKKQPFAKLIVTDLKIK